MFLKSSQLLFFQDSSSVFLAIQQTRLVLSRPLPKIDFMTCRTGTMTLELKDAVMYTNSNVLKIAFCFHFKHRCTSYEIVSVVN